GTRSIIVPITRPAQIDIHLTDKALLPPVGTADAHPLSEAIAARLDSILPVLLSDETVQLRHGGMHPDMPPFLASEGSVSRRALRWWSARTDAGVLLACQIVHSRLAEEVTTAAIRSTRNPGGEKIVRQGRAEAVCRVILVDLRKEILLFDDTLSVSATHETHTPDAAPPPFEEDVFSDDLATQIASAIKNASHPVYDREVVTFLVDDAFPAIETAIAFAEEGRWNRAADLLRRLASESEGRDDADILWYDLGLALQYQQNFKEALEAFDAAMAIRDRSRYKNARTTLLRVEQEYLDKIRDQR
ncbi:MAG: tetratricopeptide repeat protein, partial [Bacteroidetes bacterium]|nr:tetratricopeptide repeat protein [Bacteroidota bacterium]